MYNCWNEALNYLMDKYGRVRTKTTRWVRGKQIDSYFDTYDTSLKQQGDEFVKRISDEDEGVILLMKQYYYGITAKKELYYKLIDLGVIKEENNLVVSI